MKNKYEYSGMVTPPGPCLKITISPLINNNEYSIDALIDTGADISAIPKDIVENLGLTPDGQKDFYGVFGNTAESRPTFFVTVSIDKILSSDLEVVSSDRGIFLIGRDLLNKIILHADGPKEFFELNK
jgi:predicted aspartyl protease